MLLVWIFIALSSMQINVSTAINCYNCTTGDGSNCNIGRCSAFTHCISISCRAGRNNLVTKSCAENIRRMDYDFCQEGGDCTTCFCKTDYCNNEVPNPLQWIQCASMSDGVADKDCKGLTYKVKTCTPYYSPNVARETKSRSTCNTVSKMPNGCENRTVTQDGITSECTTCVCDTPNCNLNPPEDVKKYHEKLLESREPPPPAKCAENVGSGGEYRTCEAYTCQVEACTPRYSPGVDMRTKNKGNCFEKSKERLTNGCKNESVTEAGVTLDCTRCNCDTDYCNTELPEDVKQYHEMLLESRKPTTTTTATPTPTPATTPPQPMTPTVSPDRSEIKKPSGLLLCNVLVVITAIWKRIRG